MGRFLLLQMNIPNLYPKLLHPVHGNDESAEEYIFDLCLLLDARLKPLFGLGQIPNPNLANAYGRYHNRYQN